MLHLQHNEGEDEKEMHTSDEVPVDPNNPQVAGPFTQGVDPAVDGVNEERQTSEGATVSGRFQSGKTRDGKTSLAPDLGIVFSGIKLSGLCPWKQQFLPAVHIPSFQTKPSPSKPQLVCFIHVTCTPRTCSQTSFSPNLLVAHPKRRQ